MRGWSPNNPLSKEAYKEQLRRRFWSMVNKEPGQGPKGECWEWQGSRSGGYGQIGICVNGKPSCRKAHSLAFTEIYGRELKPGLFVCHECDNKSCVRNEHLWAGTQQENVHHALRTGAIKCKLSNNGVMEVLNLISQGVPYSRISKQFNITPSYISKIRHGHRRTALSQ